MGVLPNLTIACVLKSGGDFDAEYVERLRDGVSKNLGKPHRFVCFSDVSVPCDRIPLKHDLPGWWSKMELFRHDIGLEDVFYLDLDTVIIGDLNPLVEMSVPRMMGGDDSSVMALPKDCRASVWLEWAKSPEQYMKEFGCDDRRKDINRSTIYFDRSNIGDQAFIRRRLKAGNFPDGLLFRYHDLKLSPPMFSGPSLLNKPKKYPLPKNVSVIVFNHKPRPREVNWLKDVELLV